ncbi:hypothetical protein ACIBEJ_05675 [Nonomuraea sp. NPDC050790]|uniref:hypothetical protein n=1 Tax=Nonomuraea sp. NPDC050790 TaxID=3364371 RepID=UPI0037AF7527
MRSLHVLLAAALIAAGAGCGRDTAAAGTLLLPERPGELHLEQIVTSKAAQDPITVYADDQTPGGRTLAVLVTDSEDWEPPLDWQPPHTGKPIKLDRHEATLGGSGQHRWITWPIRTSQDFESYAVLGHNLTEAELTTAANGVAADPRRPRIEATHLPAGLGLVANGSLPLSGWNTQLGGTEHVWTNRQARARVSVSQLPGDAALEVLAGATVRGEPRDIRGTTGLAGGDLLTSGSLSLDWVHQDRTLMIPKVRLWRENGTIVKVSALGLTDPALDAFTASLRPATPEAVEQARQRILDHPPHLLFPPADGENRPLRLVTHGRNAERAWAVSAGLEDRTFTYALRVLSRHAPIVDGGGGSLDWNPDYAKAPMTIMHDVQDLGLPSDSILIGFAATGVRTVRIRYADGTTADLPLGPEGGPGGVRWFSTEVTSRPFTLTAETHDGTTTDTVRRIP